MQIEKSKIKIRRVKLQDIKLMVNHRMYYLMEMQGERDEKYIRKLSKAQVKYFKIQISAAVFIGYVAEFEKKPVGYGGMIIKQIPGDIHSPFYIEADILNMYTLPEFRLNGVGKLILEKLIAKAEKMKIRKLSLHTSKDGEHLYRSFGFNEPIYPYLEKNR